MAKRDDKVPNVVFVGRAKARVKHCLVLFRILDKHPDGSPRTCVLIPDDDSIDVEEGMEFMTAYVPSQMVER